MFDYIAGDDTQWEREPLSRLAADGELMAHRHEGFWQCMDTLKEAQDLNALWRRGAAALEGLGREVGRAMRVLLTGNEGYIGTILVPLLWARNHEVVGLDSGLFRECTLKAIRPVETTIRKDIRDVEPRDLDGIDAVIHLAGLSNDPLGNLAPRFTYEINHEATVRLAELAKRAGIRRFLYASTCSVYGAAGDDMLDEDSPVNPVTPYAEFEGARGARPAAARGPDVLPGVSARRDRLRRIAAAALRPRGQQPGRLGGDHRAGVPQEPRHLLAPARAHRGHRARLHHVAARARSEGAQPGVQHRPHRGELPDPRRRRDRAPDGAEDHASSSRRTPRPICATTGSAATASRASCPNTGRTGRSLKGSRRSTEGSANGGCTATTSRARATTGSPI